MHIHLASVTLFAKKLLMTTEVHVGTHASMHTKILKMIQMF